MKIASHNSWSYLTPQKWWMKLLRFTAQCQDADIETQYKVYGVRCFDLRLSLSDSGTLQVNHGHVVYAITADSLLQQLGWLDNQGDVAIRVLLDVRSKKRYTPLVRECFSLWCSALSKLFLHIRFWGGRNLYNNKEEYHFPYSPSCDGKYASVCSPRYIDDWYPRWYAKKHTKQLYESGSSSDFLMLDFVNYIK